MVLSYIFPFLIIIACLIVYSHFRNKAIKRRVDLKMIFICRNDCKLKSSHFLDMSCTSTILLYKKNLYLRNNAVLQYWERYGSAREFYKINSDDELFEIEAKCKSIGISCVVLRNTDSISFIAAGPINRKRIEILTKNSCLIG